MEKAIERVAYDSCTLSTRLTLGFSGSSSMTVKKLSVLIPVDKVRQMRVQIHRRGMTNQVH